jgi:hypothetical protein
MAYQPKDGYGSLFNNDYKNSDTQPDMRGTFLLDGVEYQISAWKKQGQRGEFMGLKIEKKQDRPKPSRQSQQQPNPRQPESGGYSDGFNPDEDVPF